MKYLFIKKHLLLFLLLPLFSTLSAQQTAHKKVIEEVNYLLYLPDGYDADTAARWPLMIFLHGSGESGDDIDKVKVHGPAKLIEQGKKFPFIVVSPQSAGGGWKSLNVKLLTEKISDDLRVDKDRIYLTGLSMGGFGTWNTAQAFPEMFAAIAPICGGGNPNIPWSLKNTPIWCFHGDSDDVVGISYSQSMIDALKPYNDDVRFTIYPGVGHDSWSETYDNDALYDWMLSHTRFEYKEVPMNKTLSHQYEGVYVCNSDTIKFVPQGNDLEVWFGDKKAISLSPASDTLFFIKPDVYEHLVFNIEDNVVLGANLFTKEENREYKKIK